MATEREPTQFELRQGDRLRDSLLNLSQTLVRTRVRRIGLDLVPEHVESRILVLPSGAVTRKLIGDGEDDEGEYYSANGPQGWTRKPFILVRGNASLGYDQYAHDQGASVSIRAQGPEWERRTKWSLEKFHYNYSFDLARHTLAVLEVERPQDN